MEQNNGNPRQILRRYVHTRTSSVNKTAGDIKHTRSPYQCRSRLSNSVAKPQEHHRTISNDKHNSSNLKKSISSNQSSTRNHIAHTQFIGGIRSSLHAHRQLSREEMKAGTFQWMAPSDQAQIPQTAILSPIFTTRKMLEKMVHHVGLRERKKENQHCGLERRVNLSLSISKKNSRNPSISVHSPSGGTSGIRHDSIPFSSLDLTQVSEIVKKGKAELELKNYSAAIILFTKALSSDPSCVSAHFYRGIARLDSQNPHEAIEDFRGVASENCRYSPVLYILLSIAYKRLNDVENSLEALSRAIKLFPNYPEAYIGRAQLFFQKCDYSQALRDFQYITGLAGNEKGTAKDSSTEEMGWIGAGDCLAQLGEPKKAIEAYTRALAISANPTTFQKRAMIFYALQNYSRAISDLERLHDNPRAIYYRGKSLNKQGSREDSILIMEQLVGMSPENKYAVKALYYICKIRLKEKNFYAAHHTLNRINKMKKLNIKIEIFNKLIEGVILIIKKKFKRSIKLLSEVVDSSNIKNRYKAKGYVYRAYSQMARNNFQKALLDYEHARSLLNRALGRTSIYNQLLCQGLIAFQEEKYEEALRLFNDAQKVSPTNREIIFYKASAVVPLFKDFDPDTPQNLKKIVMYLKSMKNEFDEGIKTHKNDHFLLFYRGIIKLFARDFGNAFNDLERAINHSDESQPKYYLNRGLTYACMSMFKEAIKDLTVAIKIKEDYSSAYFLRGKCAYLVGDTDLAFRDFQKLILLHPSEAMAHVHAGNLLMTTGSYEDAIKAFTNAQEISDTPQAIFQRARSYIALSKLGEACEDFEFLLEENRYKKFKSIEDQQNIIKDAKCLLTIRQAVQNKKGDMIVYSKIAAQFSSLIGKCSQLFQPEKRKKFLELKARRTETKSTLDNTKPSLEQASDPLFSNFILEEKASRYRENVFSTEDYFLYRGVIHFYQQNYRQAISDFLQALSIKKEQATIPKIKEENEEIPESLETDLSDVGLCAVNINEHQYNLVLCYIFMGCYEEAHDKLLALIGTIPKKYLSPLWLLKGLLEEALGLQDEARKDFSIALKEYGNAKQYLENNETIQYEVFPLMNRLCTNFPYIKLTLARKVPILVRPSFSFPFVKPPNMIPCADSSVLSEFHPLSFDCRPEAPWIKRCKYGIKFTEEIQEDSQIQILQSEEEKYIFMPKTEYNKFKQRKCRVKIKASTDAEQSEGEKQIF